MYYTFIHVCALFAAWGLCYPTPTFALTEAMLHQCPGIGPGI